MQTGEEKFFFSVMKINVPGTLESLYEEWEGGVRLSEMGVRAAAPHI